MLNMTRHFEERWMERVGNWPTLEALNHFVDHSVPVQRCADYLLPNGRPYRVLAIYWHPELDLVIKADTINNVAVTVLSIENWTRRGNGETHPPATETVWGEMPERWLARETILNDDIQAAGQIIEKLAAGGAG
jgi:hypothetical protein